MLRGMDYKKIHNQLIDYCNKTTPRYRLEQRNLKDPRLKNTHLYVEVHHIIPRSLGGTDAITNLVTLLPEEHIFIHMLRWKMYKIRNDILAVRFCLNGYNKNKTCKPVYNLTKSLRMGYAWLKQQSKDVREGMGWQSPEGRERIAAARRGKIVVKDAATGSIVGSVSTTHPKVVGGEWVHHTKGRKATPQSLLRMKARSAGLNNANSCGMSDEYFIKKGIEITKEFNRIVSWNEMFTLSKERSFLWIQTCSSRFNNAGRAGFVKAVEEATNLKYKRRHFRKGVK
jgi:HNH endonuclease